MKCRRGLPLGGLCQPRRVKPAEQEWDQGNNVIDRPLHSKIGWASLLRERATVRFPQRLLMGWMNRQSGEDSAQAVVDAGDHPHLLGFRCIGVDILDREVPLGGAADAADL